VQEYLWLEGFIQVDHVNDSCNCPGKKCGGCERLLCYGMFYRDGRWKYTPMSKCKDCIGTRVHGYKESNKDIVRSGSSRYTERTKEKRRSYWLRQLYNITPERFEEMLLQQGGACAICRQPSDKVLHVDHNHSTGKVRGLLCSPCNSLLGYAYESSERLMKAIEYLKLYEGE